MKIKNESEPIIKIFSNVSEIYDEEDFEDWIRVESWDCGDTIELLYKINEDERGEVIKELLARISGQTCLTLSETVVNDYLHYEGVDVIKQYCAEHHIEFEGMDDEFDNDDNENESEEKVFSLTKYLEWANKLYGLEAIKSIYENLRYKNNWRIVCDGCTPREMESLGYECANSWVVKRKDYVPYAYAEPK